MPDPNSFWVVGFRPGTSLSFGLRSSVAPEVLVALTLHWKRPHRFR